MPKRKPKPIKPKIRIKHVTCFKADDQDGNPTSFSHAFLGECSGIAIEDRARGDLHQLIVFLSEDDGHWWVGQDSCSSAWIDERIECLKAAKKWMEHNLEPDMYDPGYGLTQFGWKRSES